MMLILVGFLGMSAALATSYAGLKKQKGSFVCCHSMRMKTHYRGKSGTCYGVEPFLTKSSTQCRLSGTRSTLSGSEIALTRGHRTITGLLKRSSISDPMIRCGWNSMTMTSWMKPGLASELPRWRSARATLLRPSPYSLVAGQRSLLALRSTPIAVCFTQHHGPSMHITSRMSVRGVTGWGWSPHTPWKDHGKDGTH
jgi:hypothetical protein